MIIMYTNANCDLYMEYFCFYHKVLPLPLLVKYVITRGIVYLKHKVHFVIIADGMRQSACKISRIYLAFSSKYNFRKCNIPMSHHVCLSVGSRLFGWSVIISKRAENNTSMLQLEHLFKLNTKWTYNFTIANKRVYHQYTNQQSDMWCWEKLNFNFHHKCFYKIADLVTF